MEKQITVVHVVKFTHCIIEYFEEVKKGLCSSFAVDELLLESEKYLKKPTKNFEDYIDFTFNIKKKDLIEIKKEYRKEIKECKKLEII